MNRDEIEKLRQIHALKGLRLDTASGLSGTIYDADGSATAPVTALLDECERSFDKDAEITRLTARIAELEKALTPFAKISGVAVARRPMPPHQDRLWSYYDSRNDIQYEITRAHVDNARTTLEASKRGGGE